jgi:hypothetical protein
MIIVIMNWIWMSFQWTIVMFGHMVCYIETVAQCPLLDRCRIEIMQIASIYMTYILPYTTWQHHGQMVHMIMNTI